MKPELKRQAEDTQARSAQSRPEDATSTDAELMKTLRIQALLARYARCLDTDDLESWPGFFAEKCLYKVTSADNHKRGMPMGLIYADTRAMLQDRVSSLREANIYEAQAYRHILGPTLLLGERDGQVEAETGFLVVRIMRDGQTMLFASGRYLDKIEMTRDGRLGLIREKLVVCDSSRIDTLLALPL
jgi:3-phenylpropionate/cinnamic acid dioxygenase small subunit